MGKTRFLVRYVEKTFTTAFYNTVGVDFVRTLLSQKMKQINIGDKKVRIQIVQFRSLSGTLQAKNDSAQLPLAFTKEPTGSSSCMISPIDSHLRL